MIHCIYHWHSFVQIQTPLGDILIDPYITDNPKCDVTLDQVLDAPLQAICLTHGHWDHLGDTVAITQARPEVPVVAMVELCQYLSKQWVSLTYSVNLGWKYQLMPDTQITYLKAEHSNSTPDGWYAGCAASIVLQLWDVCIYHAGDTALHSDMKLVGEYYQVTCAFVPIWDRYTMWISDSIVATRRINPKIVVPIHYNTWPAIKADELVRATSVMQDNVATPKVLHPGQYVIL